MLTQSALDSDGNVWCCILHSLAAACHQLRLQHHGGTKATSARYSLTGAAAVEVDLIVAIPGDYLYCCCQCVGIASSQLTHNWVLLWWEPQESANTVCLKQADVHLAQV